MIESTLSLIKFQEEFEMPPHELLKHTVGKHIPRIFRIKMSVEVHGWLNPLPLFKQNVDWNPRGPKRLEFQLTVGESSHLKWQLRYVDDLQRRCCSCSSSAYFMSVANRPQIVEAESLKKIEIISNYFFKDILSLKV